ncbi:MAG: 30S ribosomal protein S14 [Gammaproteobacteria bacterium]|nr:30S ribosomal protein S14 [Gammaproteobacteria bacterium]
MAKKSVVYRNIKREAAVAKYSDARKKLKEVICDITATEDERWDAQKKLQALPRNASPIRIRRRCSLTGRPRGVYRKFNLSRTKLREYAVRGELPGLVKASW